LGREGSCRTLHEGPYSRFAAIIAGVFAIVSPFITWKLKNASDERARLTALDKERRDEIKQLYTGIFVIFEHAIRQASQLEEFTLARELSEATAKIHLLAPERIAEQYSVACSLLEEWSQLHFKASPRRLRVGDQSVTVIQSPDPAAKYKEPANAAYSKLQDEVRKLTRMMRQELDRSGGSDRIR
jgi:hypothetical protein